MNDSIQSSVVVSRPTLLINGKQVADLDQDLLALFIKHKVNHVSRCELRFSNWGTMGRNVGYRYFDLDSFNFGQVLEVLDAEDQRLFIGRIDQIDASYPSNEPPGIKIVAEDRLAELNIVRRTRSAQEIRSTVMIESIAADYSLLLDIRVALPDVILPIISQVNQTDFQLISHLTQQLGVEFWLDDDTLSVSERSLADDSELELRYGRELSAFEAKADLSDQVSELSVTSWSALEKAIIKQTVNHQIMANESSGKTGGEIVKSMIGQRHQRLVNQMPVNDEHARIIAEAEYRLQARRFVTGRGLCEVGGHLRIGTLLNLEGLGNLFEGQYYVNEVTHLFDSNLGFRSEFEVERPALGIESFGKHSRTTEKEKTRKPKRETNVQKTSQTSPSKPSRKRKPALTEHD